MTRLSRALLSISDGAPGFYQSPDTGDPRSEPKKKGDTIKCKIWSSDMLPPPIWNPSFEFHGLVTDINADLTGLMKRKNAVC